MHVASKKIGVYFGLVILAANVHFTSQFSTQFALGRAICIPRKERACNLKPNIQFCFNLRPLLSNQIDYDHRKELLTTKMMLLEDEDGKDFREADLTGKRLFVTGLASTVDDVRLYLAFEQINGLLEAHVVKPGVSLPCAWTDHQAIVTDRPLQTSGIGYVVFSEIRWADEALEKMKVCCWYRRFKFRFLIFRLSSPGHAFEWKRDPREACKKFLHSQGAPLFLWYYSIIFVALMILYQEEEARMRQAQAQRAREAQGVALVSTSSLLPTPLSHCLARSLFLLSRFLSRSVRRSVRRSVPSSVLCSFLSSIRPSVPPFALFHALSSSCPPPPLSPTLSPSLAHPSIPTSLRLPPLSPIITRLPLISSSPLLLSHPLSCTLSLFWFPIQL
jgi:hypothetical protein